MAVPVRFFVTSCGAKIAYTCSGSGPPIILLPAWTSHLERATELSGFAAFHQTLELAHTVIRFDRWGCGLSDRDRADFAIDADIEVVRELADHLKLRRFTVFGPSHGGPTAVAIALQEPRRVSHLVLYATRPRPLTDRAAWEALRDLIRADWQLARRAMAGLVLEGASPEDMEAFARMSAEAADPDVAIGLQDAAMAYDYTDMLGQIGSPTLVVQRRDDPLIDLEESRSLAAGIPGAIFEVVEGSAHVHIVGDSSAIADRINSFTGGGTRRATAHLTARESEVLELVASGCSNAEVADRLVLSVRTVERHLLNAYRKLGVRSRAEAAAWAGATRRSAVET